MRGKVTTPPTGTPLTRPEMLNWPMSSTSKSGLVQRSDRQWRLAVWPVGMSLVLTLKLGRIINLMGWEG